MSDTCSAHAPITLRGPFLIESFEKPTWLMALHSEDQSTVAIIRKCAHDEPLIVRDPG